MSIYNFFRGVFGFPDRPYNSQRPDESGLVDEFRNPIWGTDDSDSEDDLLRDGGRSHFGFHVFTDPLEMHRFFEQQMNEMLKNFQQWNMPDIFGQPEDMPTLFMPEGQQSKNLRDQILKPGYGPAKELHDERIDIDLDAKVKKSGIGSLIKEGEKPTMQVVTPSHGSFTSRSIIRRSSRRPDGSVEHEEIVRDSAGNEKRTVTHSIGDQSHIIITETGPNGSKLVTDKFVNIDEDKIGDFEELWNRPKLPGIDMNPKSERKSVLDDFKVEDFFKQEKSDFKLFKSILDDFSFEKFFK